MRAIVGYFVFTLILLAIVGFSVANAAVPLTVNNMHTQLLDIFGSIINFFDGIVKALQAISNIFSSVSNAISSANSIIANVVSSPIVNTTSQIIIHNSGSTNSDAWQLTIYQDGSGSIIYQQRSNTYGNVNPQNAAFLKDTFSIENLTVLLNLINVSDVGRGSCAHSVSFGTITTITYKGKTSGDVYCLRPNDSTLHPPYMEVVNQTKALVAKAGI
jgi:hypothetical protein